MVAIDFNHGIRKIGGDRPAHPYLLQTVKHSSGNYFSVSKLLQVKKWAGFNFFVLSSQMYI